jgi:hypothetical protein
VTLGDGANQTVNGTATDAAGNVKTVAVIVNVDKGKPTIAYSVVAAPNAAGWNKANMMVNFACTDGISGIAFCTAPQQISTETAGQVVSGTAADYAGNTQSTQVNVKLDKTAPTTTNAAVSGGVTVPPFGKLILGGTTNITATVADNLSGVAKAEYYVDTDPGQGNATVMTVGGGTATANNVDVSNLHGQHNVYVRTQDVAGNWSTVSVAAFRRL